MSTYDFVCVGESVSESSLASVPLNENESGTTLFPRFVKLIVSSVTTLFAPVCTVTVPLVFLSKVYDVDGKTVIDNGISSSNGVDVLRLLWYRIVPVYVPGAKPNGVLIVIVNGCVSPCVN